MIMTIIHRSLITKSFLNRLLTSNNSVSIFVSPPATLISNRSIQSTAAAAAKETNDTKTPSVEQKYDDPALKYLAKFDEKKYQAFASRRSLHFPNVGRFFDGWAHLQTVIAMTLLVAVGYGSWRFGTWGARQNKVALMNREYADIAKLQEHSQYVNEQQKRTQLLLEEFGLDLSKAKRLQAPGV